MAPFVILPNAIGSSFKTPSPTVLLHCETSGISHKCLVLQASQMILTNFAKVLSVTNSRSWSFLGYAVVLSQLSYHDQGCGVIDKDVSGRQNHPTGRAQAKGTIRRAEIGGIGSIWMGLGKLTLGSLIIDTAGQNYFWHTIVLHHHTIIHIRQCLNKGE